MRLLAASCAFLNPHPPLRGTLSQRERDLDSGALSPLGAWERVAEGRVRIAIRG